MFLEVNTTGASRVEYTLKAEPSCLNFIEDPLLVRLKVQTVDGSKVNVNVRSTLSAGAELIASQALLFEVGRTSHSYAPVRNVPPSQVSVESS